MAFYENVLIARQDLSSSAAEALGERFAAVIQENGGQVTKREYWGLRNLAFKIKKNRKGHYVLMNIDAPAPAVQEMERQMRINEDIIRFMTIRVDALEEGPSVVMQYRPGREDRPRRGERHFGDEGDEMPARGEPRDRDGETAGQGGDA